MLGSLEGAVCQVSVGVAVGGWVGGCVCVFAYVYRVVGVWGGLFYLVYILCFCVWLLGVAGPLADLVWSQTYVLRHLSLRGFCVFAFEGVPTLEMSKGHRRAIHGFWLAAYPLVSRVMRPCSAC